MANNYYRTFIILKQEDPGFAKPGREAAGRCVVEARGREGRISCYVQDLSPEAHYRLRIFSVKNGKSVWACAGPLYVDYGGKGETRFVFAADDAFSSGIAAADINAVAVTVQEKAGNAPVKTPLVGYKDNIPVPLDSGAQAGAERHDETPETNEMPEWGETEAEEIRADDDGTDENELSFISALDHGGRTEPEVAEDIRAENPQDASREVFREMVRKFNEEMEALSRHTFSPEYEESRGTRYEPPKESVIDALFKQNIGVKPFPGQKSSIEWVRVSPGELQLFPFEHEKYAESVFIKDAFGEFRHLIMGRFDVEGMERYVLGVPALYGDGRQELARPLGFRQFKSCAAAAPLSASAADNNESGHGYWLLVI